MPTPVSGMQKRHPGASFRTVLTGCRMAPAQKAVTRETSTESKGKLKVREVRSNRRTSNIDWHWLAWVTLAAEGDRRNRRKESMQIGK